MNRSIRTVNSQIIENDSPIENGADNFNYAKEVHRSWLYATERLAKNARRGWAQTNGICSESCSGHGRCITHGNV